MKRVTVLPAAILAALLTVIDCHPSPAQPASSATLTPNPPLPAPGSDAASCMTSTDSLLATRVRVLNVGDFSYDKNGYSGSGTNTTYTNPPTGNLLRDVNIKSSLKRALDLAPRSLKDYICLNLNYIYIDQDKANPGAWAFWELQASQATDAPFADQGQGLGRWIALSADLWAGTDGNPSTFADYETGKLHSTLWDLATPKTDQKPKTEHQYPTHQTAPAVADPTTGDLGLLAVIAHEVGHVVYFQYCQRPPQTCTALFHSYNWLTITNPNRTRQRAVPFKSWTNWRSDRDRHLDKLAAQWIKTPDQASQLFDLYGYGAADANWASLLAATAPDEEFVELFEFLIVRNATTPLKELTIHLTADKSVNIFGTNLARQPLAGHYDFVKKAFDPTLPN
jgi:hypothetical protein